jgi:lipopolysaccharide export system protein LptA
MGKERVRLLMVLALAALTGSAALAQDDQTIILDHADSLVGGVRAGEQVRELIGNVRIRQGNVHIACMRALQYVESGIVHLEGDVVMQDDSVTIEAPRGVYHRDTRRAEALDSVRLNDGRSELTAGYGEYFMATEIARFRTNVVVVDSTSIIHADSLRYDRRERFAVAQGHVLIESPSDRLRLFGGRLDHQMGWGVSRMTLDPVLVQVDTATGGLLDTLVVKSRIMESYHDSLRRLEAVDDVRMVRGELASVAARAVFYSEGDSILLRGDPVLWYEQTQVTGDSITVYLRSRRLDRLLVTGSAFALSGGDHPVAGRFDQLSADTLVLGFGDGQIRRITAERRATSVYHLFEDSLANGLNKASGDRIVLDFQDGRVTDIRIHGGIEGVYVPEPVLRLRPEEYRLPGFTVRTNRPAFDPAGISWLNSPFSTR